MEEMGDDYRVGDQTSQRGNDHTSQRSHRTDTAYGYGNNDQRKSYRGTASEYEDSEERNVRYDKRGHRKENNQYDDEEDPFVDAAANGDERSIDPPSGGQYEEELNDVFAQEGHHDTRASRQQKSPNNAEWAQDNQCQPTWEQQLPTITTTTTTPAMVKGAYSSLTNMLDRGEARLSDRNKISSELKWQPKNGKDKEKNKKFLESILQVRGFNAFLFMTKESSIVKMAHSAAKFATINPMADNVDGKIFAFIGDRLNNQEPQAILIPTNAWLTWSSHKVANDEKKDVGPLQGQEKLRGPLSGNEG